MTDTAEKTRTRACRGNTVAPVLPGSGTLRPLTFDEVAITGGFWGQRQTTNGTVTLRHCADWLERLGWIGNFDRTAAGDDSERPGREFADSETYKLLEGLAWEHGRTGDPAADELFRAIAARVVAAQAEDGYLNTRFGGPGQPARYTDLEWGHELYCAGHLLQAAVARLRTAGEDDFVRAARHVADHVCDTFGDGGIERVDGHPEIELGLMELARATGEDRYRHMAGVFLERRGRGTLDEIELGQAYFQDDMPIREAAVLRGHAVRALYLSAAAVDHAVDTADDDLLATLERQWEHTVERRTYLTGGMGSRHEGEAFGEDFELPPDRAYCETCAGIASVMFSWRLLLATGKERYADLIERTLYNVVAAGPHTDGDAFFYTNPLQQRTAGIAVERGTLNPRAAGGERASWFAVSCCPTNVARTFASLAGYLATADAHGVQLHQYAPSRIATTLDDGRAVRLQVATDYPAEGRVTLTVGGDTAWTLTLRVPAWARGRAALEAGSRRTELAESTVELEVTPGDEIVLQLPVEPRWSWPDQRIDAVRSQVAVEQGPLVLCAESLDLPVGDLDTVEVFTDRAPAVAGDDGAVVAARLTRPQGGWPYRAQPVQDDDTHDVELRLVPYHRWAERGPSAMRVFLPAAGGHR